MDRNNKTEIYRYAVNLETQMGTRHGELLLSVTENRIDGRMNLLGKQQSCTGELLPDGNCRLLGQLKTKRSVFDYTATGHFDKDCILLDLKYKYGVFRLTGRRMTKNDVG